VNTEGYEWLENKTEESPGKQGKTKITIDVN
jgi:hypothetical protein